MTDLHPMDITAGLLVIGIAIDSIVRLLRRWNHV